MPANLGYITALFFNQNNCAAEASTVTTKLEVDVGTDLSVMMGYNEDKCMGHLTTGGSVANIEAVWAARNVKFFPLGLQEALLEEDKFAHVRGYKVRIKSKNENKYAIHLIPKCRPINYSFVCILISPLCLVSMYKKQKNFEVKMRQRGLINMETKE